MYSKSLQHHHRLLIAGSALLIALLLQSEYAIAQPDTAPDTEHHRFSVMLAVGYTRSAFNRADSYVGIARASSPQLGAQFDYRFFYHLGVGGAMNLLGRTEYRGIRQTDGQTKQQGELSAMNAELAVVGYLPLLTQKSTLYARAGGAYINVRQKQLSDGVPSSSHVNGISPLAGLGVELELQNILAFRVGMDWYFKAGDAVRLGGEGAIQSAYCGFVFRFN
jgi:opacity protein-like surface antigen